MKSLLLITARVQLCKEVKNVLFDKQVLPNYIFTYNGNQYVRVTPYAHSATATEYKFSDNSQIGQVKAADGKSTNYRFFRIEPIKWIVLNYNKGFNESSNTKDGLTVGTMKRYELLASDVLMSGIAPDTIIWENSTINRYLNTTFSSEAFSYTAFQLAKPVIIYNNTSSADSNLDTSGSNSNYLADGSNSTTQYLYLLSNYEAFNTEGPYAGPSKIFIDADDRIPFASDYAKAHYQAIHVTTGKAVWWIRTTNGTYGYRILFDGTMDIAGASNINTGTRPAMQGGQECPF